MTAPLFARVVLACAAAAPLAPACGPRAASPVVTFAASAVGREAAVLGAQFARFRTRRPDVTVEIRATPDAADTRHQLYVQWLNAHAADPDVLQIDVIWTPEFAAAEWILPLDRFQPAADDFLPAAIAANRWEGRLFALPWFVDVGMLYWRTDLASSPPRDFTELRAQAARHMLSHRSQRLEPASERPVVTAVRSVARDHTAWPSCGHF